MNEQLLLSILSSSFVAGVVGAYVGHWLTHRREKKNRLQQQRMQYLIDAYRAFAKSNHHPRFTKSPMTWSKLSPIFNFWARQN